MSCQPPLLRHAGALWIFGLDGGAESEEDGDAEERGDAESGRGAEEQEAEAHSIHGAGAGGGGGRGTATAPPTPTAMMLARSMVYCKAATQRRRGMKQHSDSD